MSRVLLVEDDVALRNSVRQILERNGYEVRVAPEGAAAVRELQSATFEAVLLDIGLPFVDGWRILGMLEGKRQPPVIVISARGEELDKVRALDMGADDYLAKPFGAEELLARIRAVLRRAQPAPGPKRVVRAGGVVVDLAGQSVLRDGVEVRLSPTEYGLLSVLAQHAGQVMDHRTLLRSVWGPSYGDERNYLRTFVQRLRSKLEKDPGKPEIIVTVGARGYRFGAAAAPQAT
ncbi:MAG TPA: response regulator transcription factor [Candidatus Sulfotelmatobacter sp.]|nr:response regulator transcription factor [Candidatus Sulfotelmatobacter sp.]